MIVIDAAIVVDVVLMLLIVGMVWRGIRRRRLRR